MLTLAQFLRVQAMKAAIGSKSCGCDPSRDCPHDPPVDLVKRKAMTNEDMLDDCEACLSDMTDWEVEFIESLREQLNEGRDLSLAQEQKLEEIWEERT